MVSVKEFENLVISYKCKTPVNFPRRTPPFENLVISYKCKTMGGNRLPELCV